MTKQHDSSQVNTTDNAFFAKREAIESRIAKACAMFQQDPSRIQLLAVSKTFSAQAVSAAVEAGITAFGENYVQEGIEKIEALKPERARLSWHFIGPLQSNKTKEVAQYFDWMHSVDREKIARRLSEQRPPSLAPLAVCLQINVSGEATKSGVNPGEALALAKRIAGLPGLCLRGLMAIPEPTDDRELQRARFRTLASLFLAIKAELPGVAQESFDTLSMGMSADLESAIAESIPQAKTMIRVGTALFGER